MSKDKESGVVIFFAKIGRVILYVSAISCVLGIATMLLAGFLSILVILPGFLDVSRLPELRSEMGEMENTFIYPMAFFMAIWWICMVIGGLLGGFKGLEDKKSSS